MVTCMVICSIFLFSTLNYAEYLQKKKNYREMWDYNMVTILI